MADQKTGASSLSRIIFIILALAVLAAAAAWQFGLFEDRTDDDTRTVYKAGVTDESGGEFIVTDPDAPRIEDVTLPETPMTPVPADREASAAESSRQDAE